MSNTISASMVFANAMRATNAPSRANSAAAAAPSSRHTAAGSKRDNSTLNGAGPVNLNKRDSSTQSRLSRGTVAMHAGDAKDEAYWVGPHLTSFSQLT